MVDLNSELWQRVINAVGPIELEVFGEERDAGMRLRMIQAPDISGVQGWWDEWIEPGDDPDGAWTLGDRISIVLGNGALSARCYEICDEAVVAVIPHFKGDAIIGFTWLGATKIPRDAGKTFPVYPDRLTALAHATLAAMEILKDRKNDGQTSE